MSSVRHFVLAIVSCALLVPGAAFAAPHQAGPEPESNTSVAGQPGPLDILITNDDGWRGEGGASTPLIVALRDALRTAGHHVTVVSPGTDQSGQGGRISLPPNQLVVANPEDDVWTVSPGSPTDAVFFAMDQIYGNHRPDLVISGINPGNNNTGGTPSHSGTFNGASTAAEFGIPAIAVSLQTRPDWSTGARVAAPSAAEYTARLVKRIQSAAGNGPLMPHGAVVNVNMPLRPGPVDPVTGEPTSVLPPKGEKTTTLAMTREFEFSYSNTTGGSAQPGTYSIGIDLGQEIAPKGTDVHAVNDGYVSLTPLELDRDVDESTKAWLRSVLRR